jgi:formylglycine-generating enzyme required for sulfatase activity
MAFYLRKTTPSVVNDPSGVAIDSCHNAWQELLVGSKESQVHHHAIAVALSAIGCGYALWGVIWLFAILEIEIFIKVNIFPPVMKNAASLCAAFVFAAFSLMPQISAQADTFGTSGNEFTIDFVNIGNAGNAADTTSYGAVPYEYRAGVNEISQNAITKATASGMASVTAGAWTGNQPAANITWYEAAAFVNWLNTSTGKTAAYNLTFSGSWSMALWSSEQAWTAGGTNLYRNKDAFYFLPSENEWYKAAYFNPGGSNYFLYPTASSSVPTPVASGTNTGSAVYNGFSAPAIVNSAGGLSPYGTMGQGGNAWEWNESAFDGANNSSSEPRTVRGGFWVDTEINLRSSIRANFGPTGEGSGYGFRVASVPEPSTYALLLMAGAGWLLWRRRKASL